MLNVNEEKAILVFPSYDSLNVKIKRTNLVLLYDTFNRNEERIILVFESYDMLNGNKKRADLVLSFGKLNVNV